ncbi:MAG: nucleotide exchange factor GrpE [Vicinamibacterales bacterium]
MRVVDRRWWARQQESEPESERETTYAQPKPTVVEDLETQLTRAQEQLQAVLVEHRRASEEFEQVKARMRRDVAREVERGRRLVLVEMLDVVDNLDRAIDAARSASDVEGADVLLRGIELVRDQVPREARGVRRGPHACAWPAIRSAASRSGVDRACGRSVARRSDRRGRARGLHDRRRAAAAGSRRRGLEWLNRPISSSAGAATSSVRSR